MGIQKITAKSIKPYGRIIEYPKIAAKGTKRNLWKVVHKSETHEDWRIACLVLRDKSLSRLQCHPNTDETFEPVNGKAIIFLSKTKDIKTIQAFWLDKPIVVYNRIWHGIITADRESHLKIFENNIVESKIFPLNFRLNQESYLKRIAPVLKNRTERD